MERAFYHAVVTIALGIMLGTRMIPVRVPFDVPYGSRADARTPFALFYEQQQDGASVWPGLLQLA